MNFWSLTVELSHVTNSFMSEYVVWHIGKSFTNSVMSFVKHPYRVIGYDFRLTLELAPRWRRGACCVESQQWRQWAYKSHVVPSQCECSHPYLLLIHRNAMPYFPFASNSVSHFLCICIPLPPHLIIIIIIIILQGCPVSIWKRCVLLRFSIFIKICNITWHFLRILQWIFGIRNNIGIVLPLLQLLSSQK
jgi:hypothetical protein